jgi:hypothetical protein
LRAKATAIGALWAVCGASRNAQRNRQALDARAVSTFIRQENPYDDANKPQLDRALEEGDDIEALEHKA